jgi:hypothetical protein
MEGSMQFESTTKSAAKAINKVNFSRTNRSRDVQVSKSLNFSFFFVDDGEEKYVGLLPWQFSNVFE